MIRVIQGDITKVTGFDAIINPANNSLLGGGGLDGIIHRAAGPQLKTECRTLNGCETGDSKLTLGYNLPCDYIIHSVGPVWMGGMAGEEELLTSCYLSALKIAAEKGIKKIAFPSISTGEYGYPLDKASKVALSTITTFLNDHPDSFDDICFVVQDRLSFDAYSAAIKDAAPAKPETKKKTTKKTKADFSESEAESPSETDEEPEVSEKKPKKKSKAAEAPELPKPVIPPTFSHAPYNKYHIDWLIEEVANDKPHTYVCFWMAEKNSEYCQLSLWFKGDPIFINGRRYTTASQYIMSEKALLFGDVDTYKKIMNEEDPALCEKLGMQVKNFDEVIWKKCCREIIFNANVGKFLSDKNFSDALKSTGDSVIVEASPTDDIYGAGLAKDDIISQDGTLITPPQNWHVEGSDFQARNELGFVLMAVRDYFKQ
nr:macro domain-containing protein [Butyrivibrio sp. VCD2006]